MVFVWKPVQHATAYALLLSAVAVVLDYLTGPYIHFPVLFTVPVILASWYRGWYFGGGLAVLLPLLRLGLAWHWDPITPWTMTVSIVNVVLDGSVLGLLAYFVAERQALQQQVRVLHGILPICGFCKKIRDPDGHWQVLEAYITHHSEATFSHGVCPSCAQEHYGAYFKPKGEPPLPG